MDLKILLAFLFGMIILSATPEPGVFASVSTALSKGFKSSLLFIGGLVIGDIIFFMLAIIGMTAISKMMGQFFFIVKLIGGLYLVYMGFEIIRHRKDEIVIKNDKSARYKTMLSGLLVTLGNPKAILFYASIVPTIIDITIINPYEIMAIIFMISAISFIVVGFYCYLAVMSKSILLKKEYQRRVNISSGVIMITAGSFVLFKKG
jgi:threonine/homoserine/homoserine lactone efflux protein